MASNTNATDACFDVVGVICLAGSPAKRYSTTIYCLRWRPNSYSAPQWAQVSRAMPSSVTATFRVPPQSLHFSFCIVSLSPELKSPGKIVDQRPYRVNLDRCSVWHERPDLLHFGIGDRDISVFPVSQ